MFLHMCMCVIWGSNRNLSLLPGWAPHSLQSLNRPYTNPHNSVTSLWARRCSREAALFNHGQGEWLRLSWWLRSIAKDRASRHIRGHPGLPAAGLWSEVRVSLQVRELEGELEGEVRRSAEAQKGARRLERCIKELAYQVLRESVACWGAGDPWNGLPGLPLSPSLPSLRGRPPLTIPGWGAALFGVWVGPFPSSRKQNAAQARSEVQSYL